MAIRQNSSNRSSHQYGQQRRNEQDEEQEDDEEEEEETINNSRKRIKGRTFQCTGFTGCNMTFTRSEHLARHIRKHTGERPFQCPYCSRKFSRLDNLRQHKQTVHAHEHVAVLSPPLVKHSLQTTPEQDNNKPSSPFNDQEEEGSAKEYDTDRHDLKIKSKHTRHHRPRPLSLSFKSNNSFKPNSPTVMVTQTTSPSPGLGAGFTVASSSSSSSGYGVPLYFNTTALTHATTSDLRSGSHHMNNRDNFVLSPVPSPSSATSSSSSFFSQVNNNSTGTNNVSSYYSRHKTHTLPPVQYLSTGTVSKSLSNRTLSPYMTKFSPTTGQIEQSIILSINNNNNNQPQQFTDADFKTPTMTYFDPSIRHSNPTPSSSSGSSSSSSSSSFSVVTTTTSSSLDNRKSWLNNVLNSSSSSSSSSQNSFHTTTVSTYDFETSPLSMNQNRKQLKIESLLNTGDQQLKGKEQDFIDK